MPGLRVVVVYDVSDNSDRLRLSRRLQAMGLSRIQRSAFVGVAQRARVRDIARMASRIINPESDVVHLFTVPEAEWRRVVVLGRPWRQEAIENVILV
ncbi:MAG: CRISPR-associated endonuclease Cas2 [Desulfurococcales archaeon]|nr:CRISPR-associated endonuclease Cas2 [Desulfurococcales archaeon]